MSGGMLPWWFFYFFPLQILFLKFIFYILIYNTIKYSIWRWYDKNDDMALTDIGKMDGKHTEWPRSFKFAKKIKKSKFIFKRWGSDFKSPIDLEIYETFTQNIMYDLTSQTESS